MYIFKSSSPKNWSLGSLLLFQQLCPIWGFLCFLKKTFCSCKCVQEAIWKVSVHNRTPPSRTAGRAAVFLWLAPRPVSCLYKACEVLGVFNPRYKRPVLWEEVGVRAPGTDHVTEVELPCPRIPMSPE